MDSARKPLLASIASPKRSLSRKRAPGSASPRSKSKFGNKPQQIGGEKFRSKREAARWIELSVLARAGRVANLRREVPFVLAPPVVIDGRKKPALRYVADFCYDEITPAGPVPVVEDCKGFRTDVYRIKRHLMLALLGIAVRET